MGEAKKNKLKDVDLEMKHAKAKQQKPSMLRQVISCMMGWSAGFCGGLNVGYVAVGLYSLQQEREKGNANFVPTDSQQSLFGSVLNLSAMFGGLCSGWFSNRFGRKRPMVVSAVVHSAGWFVMAFPPSFAVFMGGAVVGWLAVFLVLPMARIYVSEVAHPVHRGQLLSACLSNFTAGMCAEYIAAVVLDWRGLALLNATVPLALIILQLNIPESHVWLISVGRTEDAKASLQWVYGDGYDIRKDFLEAQLHFSQTKEAINSYRDIFRFQYLKPVLIMLLLLLVRTFCGQTVVSFFVTRIFEKANSGIEPRYAAIIQSAMQLICMIFCGKMMDLVGRRRSFLFSGWVMGSSMTAFATYLYFQETPSLAHLAGRYPWMPVLFLTMAMAGFSLGIGPVLVVLLGEVLPIQIKNTVGGFMNAWMSVCALVTVASFQWMMDNLKPSGTFWLYACSSFLLMALFMVLVPETKGQTLGEIERKLTQTDLNLTIPADDGVSQHNGAITKTR